MPGAYPQLIQLDQKKPLSAVIKEVCDKWNLSGPENFALQYADGVQTYITESNRLDIKNGSILRLTKAPGRCAEDLYKGIQSSDSGVRCESLKELAAVSTDITFAQEFISRDGHSLLVQIVEDTRYVGADQVFGVCRVPMVMLHTLTAFMELMDHGIVSWENLSSVFIKKVRSASSTHIAVSLDIMESMVLSSSSLFHQIRKEITLDQLISHLQVSNQLLQTKAMALLMALLQTAGETDRSLENSCSGIKKKVLSPIIVTPEFVFQNIIHSSGSVGDEMAHHLYVLQSVRLNLLEPRMKTPLDSFNQVCSHSKRLCSQTLNLCNYFFLLCNPGQDLGRTPPGLLALDTMTYFASRYPDAYSRFVLENSSREDKHECPFARSSIQLTLTLCEILRIGEPPSETGSNYHPIFFAQDRLLEELFCICIQLLNKTWKEMRATQEDFDKVMQVVREQITRTLSSKPTSLELFKNKVNALNYSEILKLRQTERLHQEETLAPPVLELKERLKPELLELIRQQRLNRLCHGTLFRKISSRRRQDKLWYCRLSPNHKVLHYGDVEEETETPSIESLQDKIPVADIKALLTGKDCPHMKENKGKQTKEMLDLAFSITYDVEEYSLNFIASSRTDFCLWTDGLNVLLGKEMSSEAMRSELEILLSMEIKLRLLDLENVPIPDTAPPIPKPPSNFNFCYDFSQAEQ
uniref:ELMO domain-containing protein n=1 Tax=Pygocentrus nattereri TaxID=42514 RepID=A0AAR2JC56_PYGNA